jgi:hypothetical protein
MRYTIKTGVKGGAGMFKGIVMFVLGAMICSTGYATTYVVDPGGGGDAITIGGGLALAVSGDKVLVKAGTYTEHLVMVDGVVLVSESGRDVTTIQPEVPGQPLIRCIAVGSGATVEGFTIEGGDSPLGSGIFCLNSSVNIRDNMIADNYSSDDGGGIAYVDGGWAVIEGNIFVGNVAADSGGALLLENSSPTVQGNEFENNRGKYGAAICCVDNASPDILENRMVDNVSSKWGGGIAVMSNSSPLIEDNVIDSNTAGGGAWPGSGGGIAVWDNCHGEIRWNDITRNTSSYGGAIDIASGSDTKIENNTIVNNVSLKWGGGIAVLTGSSPLIEHNLIDSNTAGSADWPGSGGGIVVWDSCHTEMRWNVITRNSASYGGAIENSSGSTTIIENTTFYGNHGSTRGGCIGSLTGAVVTVRNCIIANSTGQPAIQCWDGGIVYPDCNDMWENTVDYDGCGPGASDFYEDPMLCLPEYGDFYVDCTSPCMDHPICGFVGALGAGCGSTRVEPTTWGAIKSLWR